MKNPNVFIGKVELTSKLPSVKEDDDDVLLMDTPECVIRMLGFDPLDYENINPLQRV